MSRRNSYHTTIKLAYALDIHKQWLPNIFTKAIPRSTSHGWKNENREKYVGLEYATTIGARRKGMTSLSLSSWYRYNGRYQFRLKPKRGRFKKDYHPLRSDRPNHTWHADITIVDTEADGRFYVYLIVDNFSKYIINYKVSDRILGSIRAQTLRDAVHQEFGDQLNKTNTVDLIVEGGSENNNITMEQYIKDSNITIDKKIALKDIKQSNSMVEASNKILKHRYLFQKHLYNREHLEKHLQEAVHDFCYKRPHYTLGVYTPFEVHYNQMPKIDLTKSKQAVKERKLRNRSQGCGIKCS